MQSNNGVRVSFIETILVPALIVQAVSQHSQCKRFIASFLQIIDRGSRGCRVLLSPRDEITGRNHEEQSAA